MRFEKTSAALASFMKDLTEGKQEVSLAFSLEVRTEGLRHDVIRRPSDRLTDMQIDG